MVSRRELVEYCNKYLSIELFKDYCPNGLQVEGASTVKRIITGVTACKALIDTAIEKEADMILVHHGYFWRGESEPIVGMKYNRISQLIRHDINLVGYHLPLDAHPEVGNNVMLGKKLGLEVSFRCGKNDLVFVAESDQEIEQQDLVNTITQQLGRDPLVIETGGQSFKRIAWCTGGAQSYIDAAADAGADVFISGEVSENTVHTAREREIAYIAAGHHATERYGVQALAEHLHTTFGVEHEFVEIANPV